MTYITSNFFSGVLVSNLIKRWKIVLKLNTIRSKCTLAYKVDVFIHKTTWYLDIWKQHLNEYSLRRFSGTHVAGGLLEHARVQFQCSIHDFKTDFYKSILTGWKNDRLVVIMEVLIIDWLHFSFVVAVAASHIIKYTKPARRAF